MIKQGHRVPHPSRGSFLEGGDFDFESLPKSQDPRRVFRKNAKNRDGAPAEIPGRLFFFSLHLRPAFFHDLLRSSQCE
jgi:acyl-homoserine lactone acylase PvdQ